MFLPQSDTNCRMPKLTERELLVKLYYRNSKNAAVSVRKFHRFKKQRRGPIWKYALKNKVAKFEKTGQAARRSSWKSTKKSRRRRRRYYCSGRGSKQFD
ncbi:hypothetical protein TNCV_414801 [Trichonephila clavipes]|nr:hypothetical protein TNCV_414801 [Trichonephila clavipes]